MLTVLVSIVFNVNTQWKLCTQFLLLSDLFKVLIEIKWDLSNRHADFFDIT